MTELMRRRRALMASLNGGEEPILFYSGVLNLANRPTATGVFATLNAPNCTHFLMYADNAPSNSTGKAYMGFAYWEKNAATFALGSNNSGSAVGTTAGGGYTLSYTSQSSIGGGISCAFGDDNIKLSTNSTADTIRFPQSGVNYNWFAW